MFVDVSALLIAGVIVIVAIGHVWLFADVVSPPAGPPTEDPHRQ
jgi:hypothetical protein